MNFRNTQKTLEEEVADLTDLKRTLDNEVKIVLLTLCYFCCPVKWGSHSSTHRWMDYYHRHYDILDCCKCAPIPVYCRKDTQYYHTTDDVKWLVEIWTYFQCKSIAFQVGDEHTEGETGSAAVDVHVKPTCLQPKGNYNIICRSVSLISQKSLALNQTVTGLWSHVKKVNNSLYFYVVVFVFRSQISEPTCQLWNQKTKKWNRKEINLNRRMHCWRVLYRRIMN